MIRISNIISMIFSGCVFPFRYNGDFYDSCDMVWNIRMVLTSNSNMLQDYGSCGTSVGLDGEEITYGKCGDDCPKYESTWGTDETLRVTVIGDTARTDSAIKDLTNTDIVFPDMVTIKGSAELYPDSQGDYHQLPYPAISSNGLPVYQHSARDERFIINSGQHNI